MGRDPQGRRHAAAGRNRPAHLRAFRLSILEGCAGVVWASSFSSLHALLSNHPSATAGAFLCAEQRAERSALVGKARCGTAGFVQTRAFARSRRFVPCDICRQLPPPAGAGVAATACGSNILFWRGHSCVACHLSACTRTYGTTWFRALAASYAGGPLFHNLPGYCLTNHDAYT